MLPLLIGMVRCGEGAQGTGLAKSSSNQRARQYLGAAPIQVDDVGVNDASTDAH
jgi:hypothetical protein